MRTFWFLVTLTGLLFVGWAVVVAALYRRDEDLRVAGLALQALPALALGLRDLRRRRTARALP